LTSKRGPPPAVDGFGRDGRIAVQEEYVFRTVETLGMKQIIAASLGQQPSLTDVPEFRLLATAMSDLGAHSVILTNKTQGLEATIGIITDLLGDFATQDRD
jgi:hypothetical protein